MFTGIIEEIGTVKRTIKKGNTIQFTIGASLILGDMQLGDSIAVNGVCLTVTDFNDKEFHADVMPETYRHTSLATLKQAGKVNLERAMPANGRFGGHFVSGHVDAAGTIIRENVLENAIYIDITIPGKYKHLVIEKGSVAIDGTSLTVMKIEGECLTVSLIPHTADQSVLGLKQPGETVNLEFDMMAKYIFSFSKNKTETHHSSIEDLLEKNGFLS